MRHLLLPIVATFTDAQCAFLAEVNVLRVRICAFNPKLGLEIGENMALLLSDNGTEGLRAACWDAAELLYHKVGSWTLWVEAKRLASSEVRPALAA